MKAPIGQVEEAYIPVRNVDRDALRHYGISVTDPPVMWRAYTVDVS